MAFKQTTFLGASVAGFNASLGWGSQVSTLQVVVVEDSVNGDSFQPGPIGGPVSFVINEYDDEDNVTAEWRFDGFLQSWVQKRGSSSNPIYEIEVIDPRELLDGVQLILSGYTGTINNVPNIYNVYGYIEAAQGFGASRINDTGMQWETILTGFNELHITTPISFRGSDYFVDISSLTILNIASYYRVGGENISLLGLINDLCATAGCDYFVYLLGNTIGVRLIDRSFEPAIGKIEEFVNGINARVNSDVGRELRNETTSKFLVGGPVEVVYHQFPNERDEDDPVNSQQETIYPYWGVDINSNILLGENDFETVFTGNLVTGSPTEDPSHRIKLDTRSILNTAYPTEYWTNTAEMRAVLGGQDSWEAFLYGKSGLGSASWNIHRDKAERFNLIGETIDMKDFKDILSGDPADLVYKTMPLDLKLIKLDRMFGTDEEIDKFLEDTKKFYDFLYQFASNYYGKQFMVTIPNLQATKEPDTDKIITNFEPANSGFVEEEDYANGIGLGLVPQDINKFTDDDNKLVAFARFDDYDGKNLDLSQLNEDDYNITGSRVFVKCTLEPKIQFLNKNTLEGGRIIIKLPAQVRDNKDNRTAFDGVFDDVLDSAELSDEVKHKVFNYFGADAIGYYNAGLALLPDAVAIPLKSNVDTYGPWYIIGADGKTSFEQDESLVPWNYGGFDEMNNVGLAKIQEGATQQQQSERGTVTVPGIPTVTLGGALISGGPYVTNVNVNIGEGGVTTTYNMNTWSRQIGQMSKYNIQKQEEFTDLVQKQKRKLRKALEPKKPLTFGGGGKGKGDETSTTARRDKTKSPSFLLTADILKHDDDDIRRSNVVINTDYGIHRKLKLNYDQKAVASLDAVFRPFSMDKDDTNFPHYEEPDDASAKDTSIGLSAFQAPHDMAAMTRGSEVPEDGIGIDPLTGGDISDKYRTFGLRGPLWVVGWGLDTNGKPVPNLDEADPGDEWVLNHKRRMDLWKAGPVDLRWNNEKKIWQAGTTPRFGNVITTAIADDGTGTVSVKNEDGDEVEQIEVRNKSGVELSVGAQVRVDQFAGFTLPLAAPYDWGPCP